jgi:cathepsin H
MKTLFVLLAVLVAVNAIYVHPHFEDFISKYNRTYKDDTEKMLRYSVFVHNMNTIDKLNSKPGRTWTAGINKFTDMTSEEWKQHVGLMAPQDCSATNRRSPVSNVDPPKSMDWRKQGVVTPVKDQGNCGSCWTFSTTGCLESHHAIKTGKLVSLSEQNLVDCAQAFNNHGCDGGLPSQAFEYIRYNGGLDTEDSYPYQGTDQDCQFTTSGIGATVTDVFNITEKDEDGIVLAVGTVGPVSIAYEVNDDFQQYSSGVFQSDNCDTDPQSVNHAVLVVGYDTTSDGVPYFIVKNSWGESFGIDGYFWIIRGKNECGLADCASYPIV